MPSSILSFKDVDNIVKTYMTLQTIPNYVDRTGLLIFRKFFDLCPDAIQLFSFGSELTKPTTTTTTTDHDGLVLEEDDHDDRLEKNPHLIMHARIFMNRLSHVMDMLGPDVDALEESMTAFSINHKRYGVTPVHFQMMHISIVEGIQGMIGDELTPEARKSWEKLGFYLKQLDRSND
eukprot:scaffold26976_cov181-Cylindrotheca_fusiformis.AAC.1